MNEEIRNLVRNSIPANANPEEKYLSAKKFIYQAKQDPVLSVILFGKNIWQELLERDCGAEEQKTKLVEEYLGYLHWGYIQYIINREKTNGTMICFLKNATKELRKDLPHYLLGEEYYTYLYYISSDADSRTFLHIFRLVANGTGFYPDIIQDLIKDIPKYIAEIKHDLLVSSIVMIHNDMKEERLRLFDEIMTIGSDYWRIEDFSKAFNGIVFNIDTTEEYITKKYLSKKKL